MGILNKLFSRGVEKSAAAGTPSSGLIPPLGSIQSASGMLISQATAMTVSAVYTCVTIRSRDVARCTPSLYREDKDGSRETITDHPVAKLLRRPNRQQTWFEFCQQMEAAYLLRGNAYAVILRDRRGKPVELIPINPDGVMVLEAVDGSVFYQVNRIGLFQLAVLRDMPTAIPAEDVLHIRDLSFNILVGASRIGLARESIGVAQAQSQQAARFAGNSSNPSGILKTAKTLSDGAAKRLKAQWDAFTSGIQNTGKTAVLEEGLEWQRLQLTAADMDFIKSREFEVGEVARWFQMPLYKLGVILPSQGQSGVQQQQAYVNDTIMPDLELWEQRLARSFDLDLEGIGVDLDENRLLRADVQTRYNNYRVGILSGWMSPNEARRAENMPPVDGGNQVMFPTNMAAIGSNFTGTAPDGAGRPTDGELKALEVRHGPFDLFRKFPGQPRDSNGRFAHGTLRPGDASVELIKEFLGIDLVPGPTRMKKRTAKLKAHKHPEFGAVVKHMSECLSGPDYVGQHPKLTGAVTLVKRVEGLPDGKVAVVLVMAKDVGMDGYHDIRSAFGVTEERLAEWEPNLKKTKGPA